MKLENLIIVLVLSLPLILIIGFFGVYLSPWLKAKKACEVLTFKEYFKIKTVLEPNEANLIVNAYTRLVNSGISDASINDMMKIQQCGGNIELVASRLIDARKRNIQGQLIQVALLEFEERGVNEEGMRHIREYLENQ